MTNKILNIATIAMLAITLVVLGLFIFGGELPNTQYPTPVYTEALINWSVILFAIAAISALAFPMVKLFTRPKEAVKSLLAVLGIAVVILLAYSLSDDTIMNLPGYEGSDNVPSRLIFADTILITMYILGIGAVLAILVTEVIRKVR